MGRPMELKLAQGAVQLSAYLNNCPGSGWMVGDILGGSTLNLRTKSLLTRCARHTKAMSKRNALQAIHHAPTGEHEFQPSLLRGPGAWTTRVSLYPGRWRRFTLEKMLGIVPRGLPFVQTVGAKGPFVQVWVMPKQKQTDFNEMRMRQFAELWFSQEAAIAGRHYPCKAIGRKSLGALAK